MLKQDFDIGLKSEDHNMQYQDEELNKEIQEDIDCIDEFYSNTTKGFNKCKSALHIDLITKYSSYGPN